MVYCTVAVVPKLTAAFSGVVQDLALIHIFDTETPTELVCSHIAKTPPDLRVILPNVPPMLAAVVDKLLAKMAKDRYLSSEGLLYDLTRCQREKEFVLGEKDFSRRFEFTHQLYGRDVYKRQVSTVF